MGFSGWRDALHPDFLNTMNWFEYSKLSLKKVSFDKSLLKKELNKSLTMLGQEERQKLLRWYREKFKNKQNKS